MALGVFFACSSVFNAYTFILGGTLLLLSFSQLLLLLHQSRDQNGPLVGFSASPFPLFNSLQPIRSQAEEEKGAGEQRDNTPLNYSSLCSISPHLYPPALSQLRPFTSFLPSLSAFLSDINIAGHRILPTPVQLNLGIEFVTLQVTPTHCLRYKKENKVPNISIHRYIFIPL